MGMIALPKVLSLVMMKLWRRETSIWICESSIVHTVVMRLKAKIIYSYVMPSRVGRV